MAFKKEKEGISVHFTSIITDKEGSGKELIQYSHVELKEDLLIWLKENGRLPSTTTEEYSSEIKLLNQQQEDIKNFQDET